MRRAAPTAGLSPQLIKHFAIATVSVTALLALFASGEEWGAKAQLDAVEAKNRLAITEAEKVGVKKIRMKSKRQPGSMIYDAAPDIAPDDGGGGDFGRAGYSYNRQAGRRGKAAGAPPGAPQSPRAADQEELPSGELAGTDPRKGPSKEDLEAMLEASRQRSGSADTGD